MAEIAASIIGISSFGIKLTLTLYEFGSTISSAKEQTDHIARHVTLYANVLELLADRIEEEEPILSEAAFDLVDELYESSEDIFTKIQNLLPGKKNAKDELSFLQKVAWNFKKSKVDLLVGEMDYLKSTVHLLVTVLFAGKKIHTYRRRKSKTTEAKSSTDQQAVHRQCLKAQSAIVEHINASEQLASLQEEAEKSSRRTIEDKPVDQNVGLQPKLTTPTTNTAALVTSQSEVIARLQTSIMTLQSSSEKQAFVLENSTMLLHDLLLQWTTVDLRPEGEQPATTGEQDHGPLHSPSLSQAHGQIEVAEDSLTGADAGHVYNANPKQADTDSAGVKMEGTKGVPKHQIWIRSGGEQHTKGSNAGMDDHQPEVNRTRRHKSPNSASPEAENTFSHDVNATSFKNGADDWATAKTARSRAQTDDKSHPSLLPPERQRTPYAALPGKADVLPIRLSGFDPELADEGHYLRSRPAEAAAARESWQRTTARLADYTPYLYPATPIRIVPEPEPAPVPELRYYERGETRQATPLDDDDDYFYARKVRNANRSDDYYYEANKRNRDPDFDDATQNVNHAKVSGHRVSGGAKAGSKTPRKKDRPRDNTTSILANAAIAGIAAAYRRQTLKSNPGSARDPRRARSYNTRAEDMV